MQDKIFAQEKNFATIFR